MKIICVGKNYGDHVKEMRGDLPSEPVIFMKPDTALLSAGRPFYIPDFSAEIHHEIEVVVKICRDGKNIGEKFSSGYYNELSVGIDFTARDLQHRFKSAGHPWELSKAFDGSAAVGEMLPVAAESNIYALQFMLKKNGLVVQGGNTKDMIFSVEKIIAFVSRYITLRKGDILFTGTPAGVGPVQPGDFLEGFIGSKKLLEIKIK